MGCRKLTYYRKEELGEMPFCCWEIETNREAGKEKRISEYRFGFNGQERDDEVKGTGNSYDFGARIYDPRLGRWLSLDPLQAKFPSMSPYNFVGNMPTIAVDPDGRDIFLVIAKSTQSSAELQVQHFETIINYLNSTEKGAELLSDYMNNPDKNLYFMFDDNTTDLDQTSRQRNSQGEIATGVINIGGSTYLDGNEGGVQAFNGILIQNADGENQFIELSSKDFAGDDIEVWEVKKAAKGMGHGIGAHANNPDMTSEGSHEKWGQTEYTHPKENGTGAAKELNDQINNLKPSEVKNDIKLKSSDSDRQYKAEKSN
ncbi:MAG: RHS repeat-associated core domain-containing protein [Flavobacteriales bacterium]